MKNVWIANPWPKAAAKSTKLELVAITSFGPGSVVAHSQTKNIT